MMTPQTAHTKEHQAQGKNGDKDIGPNVYRHIGKEKKGTSRQEQNIKSVTTTKRYAWEKKTRKCYKTQE